MGVLAVLHYLLFLMTSLTNGPILTPSKVGIDHKKPQNVRELNTEDGRTWQEKMERRIKGEVVLK
jgi:hypothetical protein